MSAMEIRGGLPFAFRSTIDTTGSTVTIPGVTKHLQVSNEGGNPLRVYFTKADFDANANFIELAATIGFFEGPAEIGVNPGGGEGRDFLYLRAAAATTVASVVAYLRRG